MSSPFPDPVVAKATVISALAIAGAAFACAHLLLGMPADRSLITAGILGVVQTAFSLWFVKRRLYPSSRPDRDGCRRR